MVITATYAGLLAFLFVVLSARVIGVRRSAQIAVGDQGNVALLRKMRAHANFAEYVPFAIVLMGLGEGLQAPALALHAMGATLLVGRLLHAIGISQIEEPLWMRVTGMLLTFSVIGSGAILCLLLGAPRL